MLLTECLFCDAAAPILVLCNHRDEPAHPVVIFLPSDSFVRSVERPTST